MNEFSKLLKKYREKAGLSQKALAEQAELDASHINRLERGLRKPPKKRVIFAIVRALMLNSDEIIELFSTAGYSLEDIKDKTTDKIVDFSSPVFESSIGAQSKLSHPTIEIIEEILFDQDIPVKKRKEISEILTKFARWLHEDAKRKER